MIRSGANDTGSMLSGSSPISIDPLFLIPSPPPPTAALFPYTTLFRSPRWREDPGAPAVDRRFRGPRPVHRGDRKSTRLNSSHVSNSYAVFCLKKKKRDRIDANWQLTDLDRPSFRNTLGA